MEIYFKNKNNQLEETSLRDSLTHALGKAGFKMDNGEFHGENHTWVGVVQRSSKPSKVLTTISFDEKGNTIKEVKVFESKIIEVIDDENMVKII